MLSSLLLTRSLKMTGGAALLLKTTMKISARSFSHAKSFVRSNE
jgi:hypothetical protein